MAQFVKSTTVEEAVGSIKPFGGATIPSGWILCDGSAISRTTYAALFSIISTGFGVGDGSTTFNVPNGQGVFLRGAGSQTINTRSKGGGTLGDTNEDQSQDHKHNYNPGAAYNIVPSGGVYTAWTADAGSAIATQGIGNPTTNGTNGTPRTGTTTEPSSIDINYIIKY